MSNPHWSANLTMTDEDIELLTALLLERETPLSTEALARLVLERRVEQEIAALKDRYQNAKPYNPAHKYDVGQRIVFPIYDFAIGKVSEVRPGDNPDYGEFDVIAVEFESNNGDTDGQLREFAADLKVPHKLGDEEQGDDALYGELSDLTVDDLLYEHYDSIINTVDEHLNQSPELTSVADTWFPLDLILEVNEGHLNLAEAVLDIAEGGPLDTEAILAQIGGVGEASLELQTFSMNIALRDDPRFDEVGPTGQVLWYLAREEPQAVKQTPAMLRYKPINYERDTLTTDMLDLEVEIDDEYSPEVTAQGGDVVTITLIYPHRRVGTLPLNTRMRRIFPKAERTSRIWVTLVDAADGEEYTGWVVRDGRYVYGLQEIYRKHQPPIGAYVTVRPGEEPDKVVIEFDLRNPRKEYIRLISPKNDLIAFDNHKRAIAAEYDDLMILGAEDVSVLDDLFESMQAHPKNLTTLLRGLIAELSRLSPQGTVHAKTLYSAVNVLRRCPPGPIFATLMNEPDFEYVGSHYWMLSSE